MTRTKPAADPWLPDLLAPREMAVQRSWQATTYVAICRSPRFSLRTRRPLLAYVALGDCLCLTAAA
jgi:hypothetical protein